MVTGVSSDLSTTRWAEESGPIDEDQPCYFQATQSDVSKRIDRYLAEKLPTTTRSKIKTLIEAGNILLNNCHSKPSSKLKEGDAIIVNIPTPEPISARPEPIPLEVIYEDNSIIVIDKPTGLVVHTGAGHMEGTLVNALLYHAKGLSGIGGALRPGIVHRLDKDTSGIMVVAKNDASHVRLANQFKERSTYKKYIALVWGTPPEEKGVVDTMIGRHSNDRKKMSINVKRGRRAITCFKVIKSFDNFSLLDVILKTGRTHQIRVHLAHIHHPVVGDQLYGRKSISPSLSKPVQDALKGFKRQALHASILGFTHPDTDKYMEFTAPLPNDMSSLIECISAL